MSDQELNQGVPHSSGLTGEDPGSSSSAHDSLQSDEVMENKMFSKQRRWRRYPVDMSVRIATHGPTRMQSCEGRGTDLSWRGLAVTAELDLEIGSQITVEFTPPFSDQAVTFRCFVRNRNGIHYGVEFITENDDDYNKAGELQHGLASM
jgi:hypothetical protein